MCNSVEYLVLLANGIRFLDPWLIVPVAMFISSNFTILGSSIEARMTEMLLK